MSIIGRVVKTRGNFEFEWLVDGFSVLSEDVDELFTSSSFGFSGNDWYMGLYPNGEDFHGYTTVNLYRETSVYPIQSKIALGLRKVNGSKILEEFLVDFHENSPYGCFKIQRTELLSRKSEFLPLDILSIICNVECLRPADSRGYLMQKCSHCKNADVAESSIHVRNSTVNRTKCQRCDISSENWHYHEYKFEKSKATKASTSKSKVIVASGEKVKKSDCAGEISIVKCRTKFYESLCNDNAREERGSKSSILYNKTLNR